MLPAGVAVRENRYDGGSTRSCKTEADRPIKGDQFLTMMNSIVRLMAQGGRCEGHQL